MKIQDLLEDLVNATIDRKNYNGTLKSKEDDLKRSHKELGNGSQASVKPDPNDPHMIKKHNTRVYPPKAHWEGGKTNDGYNEYIEFLINHNLTDNIHFPKVYNVKTITDKKGNKIHTYTMEMLTESDDLRPNEIDAFLEHNVTEAYRNKINETSSRIDHVCNLAGHCIIGFKDTTDVFTNKELIDAIELLKRVKTAIHSNIDLAGHNVMWRRTPYGMILVFTDPFY